MLALMIQFESVVGQKLKRSVKRATRAKLQQAYFTCPAVPLHVNTAWVISTSTESLMQSTIENTLDRINVESCTTLPPNGV
jgi:hypothetical protein